MSKYRIYIDEVGNSDLDSSSNPNHRFLSLTGVIVDLEHIATTVHPEMELLKSKFFSHHPDEPIIFHRKEMVNAKPPFETLKEEKTRQTFDIELTSCLEKWQYKVITVCIDKLNHKQTYATWQYDPYHYCLEILLERYIFFLDSVDSKGDVLAESRGGKEDRRLKDSFKNLCETGTHFLPAYRLHQRLTSLNLKVKNKSNNVAGLQLADLLAHPSRNEVLYTNGLLTNKLPLFCTTIVDILQHKYYRDGNKIFGKKMIL